MKRRQFNKNILMGLTSAAIPFSFNDNITFTDMNQKIKPQRLKVGDTVGLITPSSSITETQLEKAIKNMKSLGLKVKLGKHVRAINGYLAGTDKQRLEDLHTMFADKTVHGIWCIRGGYGVGRILPKINYQLIRDNPKVLIGYSDITALLLAVYEQTGLVCFHGPVASSDFTDYSVRHLKGVLMEQHSIYPIYSAKENYDVKDSLYRIKVIRAGKAKGELTGGNLTLLAAMAGTPFRWDVKDKLVFMEDIGERPYRVDRMLTQVLQSTNLQEAAGIILGIFEDCRAKRGNRSLSLMECLEDRLGHLEIPIIYGLSFGHIKHHFTIPIGIKGEMDTATQSLTQTEMGTKG
ncbi:MAG: LD-carboxypeptidase, partial [Bacteroidota bacterium]